MVQTERIIIDNKEILKSYSNQGLYLLDENGIMYLEAYDLINNPKNYIESEIFIKQ